MLFSNLLWIFNLLSLFDAVLSSCDSRPPLLLSVGNTFLYDNGAARGRISVKVGTPPQTIAAVINAGENNTSLWGIDQNDSETWVESGESENIPSEDTVWGRDSLHLNPDITIDNFPFTSSKSGPISSSSVGLGRNSTILDSLVQQGTIASKTWSLFMGWQVTGKSKKIDGVLALGGYDKAKTVGHGLVSGFSEDRGCPTSLVAEMSDILLSSQSGGPKRLGPDASQVRMCIDPNSPFTTLPKDVYERLKDVLANHRRVSTKIYEGIQFENEDEFNGNMTFKLSTGPSITIPNHQLIVPKKDIDDKSIILLSDSNTSKLPILGHSFLSSSYLHVDNELQQFTIWPAHPTKDTDLVSVDHRPYSSECIDSQTRLLISRSAPEGKEEEGKEEGEKEEPPPPPARPILGGGEVPGIAFGVIVGVVFIFLTAFFVYQGLVARKLKRRSRTLFSN